MTRALYKKMPCSLSPSLLALFVCVFLLAACRDPIGTACVRKGDGFTARHNCKSVCLSIWRIQCPDGSIGNSNVCAGEEGCTRGSCGDNQVCYQTNMDRSFCIPENICTGWADPSLHPPVALRQLQSRTSSNVTAPAITQAKPQNAP